MRLQGTPCTAGKTVEQKESKRFIPKTEKELKLEINSVELSIAF